MTTNTPGSVARQDPRQVSNTLRGSINFSQQATFIPIGTLPKGAWVSLVQMSIDVAFNAATTNPITVGSAGSPAFLMASTDNTPATPGVYIPAAILAKYGKGFAAANDVVVGITYTPTGAAPTTGSAEVLIEFEGGFPG